MQNRGFGEAAFSFGSDTDGTAGAAHAAEFSVQASAHGAEVAVSAAGFETGVSVRPDKTGSLSGTASGTGVLAEGVTGLEGGAAERWGTSCGTDTAGFGRGALFGVCKGEARFGCKHDGDDSGIAGVMGTGLVSGGGDGGAKEASGAEFGSGAVDSAGASGDCAAVLSFSVRFSKALSPFGADAKEEASGDGDKIAAGCMDSGAEAEAAAFNGGGVYGDSFCVRS